MSIVPTQQEFNETGKSAWSAGIYLAPDVTEPVSSWAWVYPMRRRTM